MTAEPRDPFWQQQIDQDIANRGRHADPSACGTCRTLVANGKPVEDDVCAQRATLIQPPDMPCGEVLAEMTEEEKQNLPARFHLPVFGDVGKPNAWLCAVCWGDGWVSGWPCKTATLNGKTVFTPKQAIEWHQREALAELTEARTKLKIAERRNEELADELEKYVGHEPTVADEMAYLTRCLDAVVAACDAAENGANRWENPLPVPEWVAVIRKAANGGVLDDEPAGVPW